MKTLLTTTLLAAGLSLSTASYSAAVDFINNGHYTTDTISGLDWLDVTQTAGMSWNEVNSQLHAGGSLAGWQFATGSQFLTMVNNFAGTAFTSLTVKNGLAEGIADTLVQLLGDTYSYNFKLGHNGQSPDQYGNLPVGTYFTYTYGFLMAPDEAVEVQPAFLYDYDERDPFGVDFAQASTFGMSKEFSAGYLGSFLVRDPALSAVPIPAAAFLFAPALLGFLGLRHKRRA
jgi:hypothetical protein